MNITDRTHVSMIINALTATGAKAPKAVTEAHDRATRLSDAARDLGPRRDALTDAIVAALDAGRDAAADANVQRTLAAATIAGPGIAQAVDVIAFDRFREVCHEQSDDIVRAWRGPFDAAAAALVAAHQLLGNVSLDDTTTILQKGPNAAAAWAQAQAAVKTMDTVAGGWLGLVEFTRTASNDPRYPVLRIAAVDYSAWAAKELERRKLDGWEAVLAGLALALPLVAEYRERVATIEAGDARAQQQAEQDNHDALTGRRRTAGVI